MRTSERRTGIWRLSLEQIEATVARSSRKWTRPWEPGCRVFESTSFHVSGQERRGMEHDQNRAILQRSPPHHCSSRD